MKNIFLATIAAVALPVAAFAQIAPAPTGPADAPGVVTGPALGMAPLSVQDKHFIKIAAMGGMSEVNDGMLAEKMGDSSVQNLGTMMVTDHTKANDQLMGIAKQKGVTPPSKVGAKHAAVTAELKTLKGASFDRKYLSTELTGHEMTIAAFKVEASMGSDPDLKAFASSTLPTLEHHLAMIKAAMKAG